MSGKPHSSKVHVAIVGLMGAGKSTVGRRLAAELRLAFVDTDESVVASTGRSIADIFACEGEAAFRVHERAAVERAFAGDPAVVALGGGAVCFEATRALVAERAVRVYLELSARTVLARLRRSRTVRPLMGLSPSAERVRALLEQREPYYREAEITVAGERRSTLALVVEIARRLREHAGSAR